MTTQQPEAQRAQRFDAADMATAAAQGFRDGVASVSAGSAPVEWMPLTPELLTAIESGDHGRRFWLAAHNNSEPLIGCYEWQQGRNPHGFNVNTLRYGASEITHVLPYKPPTLPESRKQGEKQ